MNIRYYTKDDYDMIKSWWEAAGVVAPLASMMPTTSSFIMELDEVPALSLTLYLTNAKGICYLEHFVGNPEIRGKKRKEASKLLVEFTFNYAKGLGFENIVGFGINEKLVNYYEDLGMTPSVRNLVSLVRTL